VLILAGCGGNSRKAESFTALPFPDVTPSAMIADPMSMAEYMSEYWWDKITDVRREYPCDTSLVSGVSRDDVEQKFANWTNVLGMVDMAVVEKSMNRLYNKASACERKDTSSNVFETFTELVGKYLYDPNSPLRNEDHYAFYAARLAKSDLIEPVMRKKYANEVRLAALNRVGTKAADFRFTDKRGRTYTLYGINSELTLLFFSNPGCGACKEIIDVLNNDPVISKLIADGTMKVLNIYIDEDLQSWMDYMSVYPQEWYNGFDPDMVIRNDNLYSVRAIPSLYLLDDQKRVIMKDAPEVRVMTYLQEH
jgi:thiol-disulfide isomerase/thioredoxin